MFVLLTGSRWESLRNPVRTMLRYEGVGIVRGVELRKDGTEENRVV